IAGATLGEDVVKLLVHDVFVTRDLVPGTEHADGSGEAFAMFHVREEKSVGRARMMRVVDEKVGFGDAVAELNDFDVTVGFATDAFVAILAEDKRLAVFELDDVLAAGILFGKGKPGAVVEDIAVLQNFDERGTLVRGG